MGPRPLPRTLGRVAVRCSGSMNATKSFGGTVAVQDVSLELHAGEVLALLGENGAGKSTCVKLLAGVYQPDAGAGRARRRSRSMLRSPLDAQRRGIAVMHQHPGLFPDLCVAENIFIGHVPTDRCGRARPCADAARGRGACSTRSASPADPTSRSAACAAPSSSWSRSPARSRSNARVLIMDEPTAALSQREVDRLFAVVDELRGAAWR